MSKLLHKWIKPGYGPVLKIMADASYDPETTPNTDWSKFRFNSEVEEIGYSWGRSSDYTLSAELVWDDVPENWGTPTVVNYPRGASDSSCLRRLAVYAWPHQPSFPDYQRRQITGYAPCLSRGEYASLGYKPIMIKSRDRSDWTVNWTCSHARYVSWVDGRYISQQQNVLEVTDLASNSESAGIHPLGLLPRYVNASRSYLDNANYVAPDWFGPGSLLMAPSIVIYNRGELPVQANDDIIITELPLENDPYPAVVATFTPDQWCLHLSPSIARMSKPGFDVDMATRDQLIFSQDKFPLKCVKAGFFTLPPAGTVMIDIDYPITSRAWVEDQINVTGQPLRLPPFPDGYSASVVVQHRIVGQQLQYRNQSAMSVDVRFFVMSGGDAPPSVGSAPVLDEEDGVVTIRRPGTAGTSEGDIILDSRVTTLPIVAQGWVDGAALTATPSDIARFGTRMHVVNFTNDSSFKPLVLAVAKYSRGGGHIWQSFFGKNIDIYSYMSASTFMATVEDSQIKFYFHPTDSVGNRFEDSWRYSVGYYWWQMQMQLVGFRYYIFAVPTSL